MDRNLDRRVEALFPLLGSESIRRCEEVLRVLLSDVRNSWVLQPDGAWVRREELEQGEKPDETRSAFTEFKLLAARSEA